MSFFSKPISISLSPNTEKDDILCALKLIFQPWQWKKGKASRELEQSFRELLGIKYTFAFNSGRAGLMAILQALGVEQGDEVLLQGFTCNAAVNPILAKGAKPVFVDVDDTINMDPRDLKTKITSQAKAVVVQHNFGCPAQIDKILEICRENNLYLIEDCAHSLGAKYKGKYCGTFGDIAFFSFGRDKIISSVFGGMAVTNNEKLAQKIKEFQEKIDQPSNFWIFQQLLHPILVNYLILPAYGLHHNLGRIFLGIFHKASILSKAVYKKEKKGEIPRYFPKKLPNALAALTLNQFKKLERFNKHRRQIADFYERELTPHQNPEGEQAPCGAGKFFGAGQESVNFVLPLARIKGDIVPAFMRYPILVNPVRDSGDREKRQREQISNGVNFDTDKILKKARKQKIFLDDGWRKSVIVPLDTDLKKMGYIAGSCPRAEKIAETIINLPTHINISQKQAQKITNFLKTLV